MGSDRPATDLTAEEIRAAIPQVLEQAGGRASSGDLPGMVATATGTVYPEFRRYDTVAPAFNGKVNRIAARMAEVGMLVKVPARGRLPGGGTDRSQAWFYTRQRHEQDARRGEESLAAFRRDGARWIEVRRLLALLGISFDSSERLALGDWERLAGLALRGAGIIVVAPPRGEGEAT